MVLVAHCGKDFAAAWTGVFGPKSVWNLCIHCPILKKLIVLFDHCPACGPLLIDGYFHPVFTG